jgi:CelD/BcsL family acetyltransferase involved in cellulose biosynthesis
MEEISLESIDGLERLWKSKNGFRWDCIFTLPPWIRAWWMTFGNKRELFICVERKDREIIGVAPFMKENEALRLIGDPDLCDYGDFVLRDGYETGFLEVLFTYLKNKGIEEIDLGRIHEDSRLYKALVESDKKGICKLSISNRENLYVLDLPETWDDYLHMLSSKERHEIRRKLRRLFNAGDVEFRDDIPHNDAIDIFISLFKMNRPDKAEFMDKERETFFRTLVKEMSVHDLLRLYTLSINQRPVASVMCIDDGVCFYLYNNGYDKAYGHLSVGLLSKILTIKEGIHQGRKKFNFLRGDEAYKQRLGGRPEELFHCRVIIR